MLVLTQLKNVEIIKLNIDMVMCSNSKSFICVLEFHVTFITLTIDL